jgi:hypothetical protein
VITVGASENDRRSHFECDAALTYTTCAAQGGQNSIFTYGSAWPERYPANPLRDDPSAGNAEQMAAFSSRGPTSDGRIKPDVVAGTTTCPVIQTCSSSNVTVRRTHGQRLMP